MSSPAQGGNADPRVTGISKGAQIALGAVLAALLPGRKELVRALYRRPPK